jgi:hypothetical protein
MPLRALVDGREVQVWELTAAEWVDLRRRCRAEVAPVLMACCGRPGLAKTSRNGNPFFAHRSGPSGPAGASCRWAAESAAHALCKLLVAAGARRAGWEVRTEAAAADGSWRADVLCTRGAVRVALEVQLARAAPGELRARQERYAAAGVRGAWFLPPARCPEPSRELPSFPLEVRGGAAGIVADPLEALLPLDEYVERLLNGQVAFEEGRVTRPLACPVAVTAPDVCRRCGAPFEHVAGLANVAGVQPRYRVDGVPVVALRDLWEADQGRARTVIAAVRGLRRTEPGLSRVAPWRCPVVGETYLTALCPSCGLAQGDAAVDRLLTSLHPRAPVRVPIPPAPLTFRPLDGRPPRPVMGDWAERAVQPRWRLRVGDAEPAVHPGGEPAALRGAEAAASVARSVLKPSTLAGVSAAGGSGSLLRRRSRGMRARIGMR